jgi:hypothetical protein
VEESVEDMQRLDEAGHGVHGNAGAEDGHHGEGAGVERAGLLVEAHAQKLGHAASLGAVVEGHHEDADKDHGGDGADAVEVGGLKAVLRAGRAHADDFLRAEVGGDKGETADPCGQGAAGLEEVFARLHVALEGKADAQHKDEVQQHDQPVDGGEIQHERLLKRKEGGTEWGSEGIRLRIGSGNMGWGCNPTNVNGKGGAKSSRK